MKVILKNVRASFMDVFEPKLIGDSTDPKFSGTFIIGEDSTARAGDSSEWTSVEEAMQAAIDSACQSKWKKPGDKVPKLKNWCYNKADGSTYRDEYTNEDGDYWDGFDGETYYVSASKRADRCKGGKMKVLDQNKNPIEANSGDLFSGCYVNVILDVYPMDRKDGKSVQASLEAVQLLRKGEPLGFAEIDADEEFDTEEIDTVDDGDTDAEEEDGL